MSDTWKPGDALREITDDVIHTEDSRMLKLRFDVALMRDENRRLRTALNAYRSALRSGEKETDQLRELADDALRETDSWEDWE